MIFRWNQPVGQGSFIVFQRLNRFYKTFIVLCGLTSALSAGVLQFQEFHPTQTDLAKAAEGFFVSATAAAVISAMLGTMLLFRFEGYETATHKDLALAWSPLVILDWSILAFLMGLVTWYAEKHPGWRIDLVGSTVGLGLAYVIWVSVDMYSAMKRPGGLGRDDPDNMVGARMHDTLSNDNGLGDDSKAE